MSASAAGAAAAAAARRRREEEEEMSGYTAQELAEGWEFKFVRSSTGAFRKPEFLRQVLEEEAKTGWTLVEKFDNGRIRLKRRAESRAGDQGSGVDAYRTQVGIGDVRLALTIIGCVLAGMGIIIAIVLVATH